MKVLQTLGQQSAQHGVFQYCRMIDGVHIDLSIGLAPSVSPQQILFTHEEWKMILGATKKRKILKLTDSGTSRIPSLHILIKQALPAPSGFQSWNDSYLACVCAILQHEGSIVIYAGGAGQGKGIAIHVAPAKV